MTNPTRPARYRVTDTVGTSGEVVADAHDVAESITPWYPEAPQEVLDQVQALEDALLRGDDYAGHAEYLGVFVERA